MHFLSISLVYFESYLYSNSDSLMEILINDQPVPPHQKIIIINNTYNNKINK